MSNAKRRKLKEGEGGRGLVERTVVAGIRDRETNKMTAKVAANAGKPTLQGFIHNNVEAGAQLHTDEARAYWGMDDYAHEAVSHSVWQYVKEIVHINGIDSIWAAFKRGYQRTFHHVSPQNLQRYFNEFAGRHTDRCLGTINIMSPTVQGSESKRLPYRKSVA